MFAMFAMFAMIKGQGFRVLMICGGTPEAIDLPLTIASNSGHSAHFRTSSCCYGSHPTPDFHARHDVVSRAA